MKVLFEHFMNNNHPVDGIKSVLIVFYWPKLDTFYLCTDIYFLIIRSPNI